jgi:hypothetical protein
MQDLRNERRSDMNLSRRSLIWSAVAFGVRPAQAAKKQEVYRFRTADAEVEMTFDFHDRYVGGGFWFREETSNRRFCLSSKGETDRNCLPKFRGSLAIARYAVRTGDEQRTPTLREYVRTIDHDARLDLRPPFERAIKLEKGIGSDLQAFGYEPSPGDQRNPEKHGPWYLFRQDLFLEPQPAPFLVIYWKHALSSIRVLDLIPGDQTWAIK